ncbi:MAG: hypothetical protein AAF597_01005, partial [Bacteroidota bacterium]
MEPRKPLTGHEKLKKELLALGYEQLLLVSLLMLSRNEVNVYDANQTLDRAYGIEPEISRWNTARIQRHFKALTSGGFVRETYRGYALQAAWRDVAVFAADGLGVKRLDALVEACRQQKGYPQRGQPSQHWRQDYEDITQRCIHKILLGKDREFDQLFFELTRPLTYAQFSQTAGENRINRILRVIDWSFWKKRPAYVQWTALSDHQENPEHWTPSLPQELESMLIPLLQRPDATDFRAEIGALVFLGAHHFAQRGALFGELPGIRGLIQWLGGDSEAALDSFLETPEITTEDQVGPVEVVDLLIHFSAGKLSAEDMLTELHTFQRSEQPLMVNAIVAFALFESGQQTKGETVLMDQFEAKEIHVISWLFLLCVAAWMGVKLRKAWVEPLFEQLEDNLYQHIPWLERELVAVLKVLFPRKGIVLSGADSVGVEGPRTQVQGEGGLLLGMLPVRPQWAYTLRLLQRPAMAAKEAAQQPAFRTIWIVDFDDQSIYCKEQKQ